MEAAEADLKGRLALAEEQNLLLNKQLADLQAACATHEKRRQELAATVQALQVWFYSSRQRIICVGPNPVAPKLLMARAFDVYIGFFGHVQQRG